MICTLYGNDIHVYTNSNKKPKTIRLGILNRSFQVSKYLTFFKDAGASKTTFKIGKNLFKPAIAFDLTTTIAYVPIHGHLQIFPNIKK